MQNVIHTPKEITNSKDTLRVKDWESEQTLEKIINNNKDEKIETHLVYMVSRSIIFYIASKHIFSIQD